MDLKGPEDKAFGQVCHYKSCPHDEKGVNQGQSLRHCESQTSLNLKFVRYLSWQGIQDGTLPAEIGPALSDQAAQQHHNSPSRVPTAPASLDRLVLNQLVTVLQATSELAGARSGSAAAVSSSVRSAGNGSGRPHRSEVRSLSLHHAGCQALDLLCTKRLQVSG